MADVQEDLQGTHLLAQEIREEAGRLAHHPIDEIRRLESVVEDGDSPTTMLLLTLFVGLALALVVAVVIALAFIAYYRA